jgi:hypothetical protein
MCVYSLAVKGLLAGNARPSLRLRNDSPDIRHGRNRICLHIAAIAAALMPVAVDPKRPKQNLGHHPRLARKAKKPAPLIDPAAALLYRDEKTYRDQLWHDFVRFVRDAGAWVVTPPAQGQARC